ncbi:hypothetical protein YASMINEVIRUS_565 [Yasminevirus sp. GU-2018]|uniref:Uncharacterized protein n=1 Tax=Yasminevirus sp. GU-2018 TaxID=2420051 RepID=A0A5K0U9H7_9VIRU|nr:hypothetical protein YASMINEVIRUS_565 [Yasminevirus sp. GU-2018]
MAEVHAEFAPVAGCIIDHPSRTNKDWNSLTSDQKKVAHDQYLEECKLSQPDPDCTHLINHPVKSNQARWKTLSLDAKNKNVQSTLKSAEKNAMRWKIVH